LPYDGLYGFYTFRVLGKSHRIYLYIEKVALDKYQQKITAYIDMDIECSRWYDDAHAMLDDGRIWSFQENDFVVTKMSRYGCWNGFGSAVILFYIFTIFRFIFRKREEVGT